MGILSELERKAKKLNKKIIFPEDEDARVIEAVCIIAKNKIAVPVLLGNKEEIDKKISSCSSGLKMPESARRRIRIIDFSEIDYDRYAQQLYKLRKNKGLTPEDARNLLRDKIYVATMMLKMGEVDGLISGAAHPTAHTLKPAFQIIKTKPGVGLASSCFLIMHKLGSFIFADCAVNPNPNEEQLADIAISAADAAGDFGIEPRVAMLSFSTHGSAENEMVEKVRNATKIARKKKRGLVIDGEMQLDSAIVPEVSRLKFPNSKVPGNATVLIFPDLNSGNIGYKLVERFGGAIAIGPMIVGLAKPVNDLSRGCKASDIVGMAIITAIQAGSSSK